MKARATNSLRAISPARLAAFEILLRVERENSHASELLHSGKYVGLSGADHSLATEITMGVLRWRSLLDSELAAISSQPFSKLDLEVLIPLRIAIYQLRRLDRIPASAAINESVELVKRAQKRSAAPFVNAVLRKLLRERKLKGQDDGRAASTSLSETAANYGHPLWLVERWAAKYGIETTLKICEYDQSIPKTAIRMRDPEAEAELRAEGIELFSGAFLTSARIVRRGNVTETAAFKAGRCTIQDEGSQLIGALVGRGQNILDCCAAPGSKTLAIADRNPRAKIAAVEIHRHRANLLRKLLGVLNANRAAFQPVQIIAGDARNLPLAAKFDRILADVPCSGTGTLARNPEIKWRLKPEDLIDLQKRQVAILRSAMKLVAAGGRLIYSTCSLEKEENEDVVKYALEEDSSFRVIDCSVELNRLRDERELIWQDASALVCGPFLRTIPGIHPCDGFFAAILEKI